MEQQRKGEGYSFHVVHKANAEEGVYIHVSLSLPRDNLLMQVQPASDGIVGAIVLAFCEKITFLSLQVATRRSLTYFRHNRGSA